MLRVEFQYWQYLELKIIIVINQCRKLDLDNDICNFSKTRSDYRLFYDSKCVQRRVESRSLSSIYLYVTVNKHKWTDSLAVDRWILSDVDLFTFSFLLSVLQFDNMDQGSHYGK